MLWVPGARDVRPVIKLLALTAWPNSRHCREVTVMDVNGVKLSEEWLPVVCWLYSSVLTFGSCGQGGRRIGNHVDRVRWSIVVGPVWSMVSA